MLLEEDCIPCILKMSLEGLRKISNDQRQVRAIFQGAIHNVMTSDKIWDLTSAEVVEKILVFIQNVSGCNDLFYETKRETNSILLQYYPSLLDKIRSESDPILEAIKLAILGNTIDTMVQHNFENIVDILTSSAKSLKLDMNAYSDFVDKLSKAKKLLYIGDNSAEAILDKLFLQIIHDHYNLDVTFVVRNEPTLNDVTMEDAIEIGLRDVAGIITNGIKGPLPGVILKRCGKEFLDLFHSADLIISKGGGNVETLSGEPVFGLNILFLLMCKCPVHMRCFGVPLGEAVICDGRSISEVITQKA